MYKIPGCNVTVTYRCHRDDGPVEGGWHGDKLIRIGVLLHNKGEAGEDQHSHDDHQPQQAQFLVGVLESSSQGLKSCDVAAKPEYSKDPHDPEHLGHPPHLILILSRALHVGQSQGYKVGDNAQQVNHIHSLLDKVPFLGRGNEPHPILYREPGDKYGLCYRKVPMFIGLICLRVSDLGKKLLKPLLQMLLNVTWKAGIVLRIRAAVDTITNPIDITAKT